MNTAFGLATLAASIPLLTPTLAAADGSCTPHALSSETRFPLRSQLRGQMGTVYLDIVIDDTGHARSAQLQRSSGYRLLDRAAADSVMDNWLFDISSCERKDLPINHLVAVEYRNDEY